MTSTHRYRSAIMTLPIILLGACAVVPQEKTSSVVQEKSISEETLFERATEIVPFESGLRRKWGGPVIADLDNDGWEEILTTAHGHAVNVYWNNQGRFSEPVRLISGDTHGLGVADLDRDGRMDIVIARGGANGNNPRRPVMFTVNNDRSFGDMVEFDFFEKGRGRSIKFLDVDQDADLDMIVTGFAQNFIPDLTTNQLYINKGGNFEWLTNLPRTVDALSFQMLTTDYNDDGDTDLIIYGGRQILVLRGEAGAEFSDVTQSVMGNVTNLEMISSIVEFDYDNDKDIDLFVTRAPLQFEQEQYFDQENKRFAFFNFRGAFKFDDMEIDGDLVIENIQETYQAKGVYLGAASKPVRLQGRSDQHAGGMIRVRPSEASGWPTEDAKLKGLHVGYLGDGIWRVGGHTNSRFSATILNVLSSPSVVERGPMSAMLLENRDGVFVDVSEEKEINLPAQSQQAVAGDFDNDGWIDLAVIPYGDRSMPIRNVILMNQKGKVFLPHTDHGAVSTEVGATGKGADVFDFNRDGRLDLLFGNEGGLWHLMRNRHAMPGGHLVVQVGSSPKAGAAATRARINIDSCGVTQRRDAAVNGDGYHTSQNTRIHFGIGDCGTVQTVRVRWANGEVASFYDVPAGTELKAGQ